MPGPAMAVDAKSRAADTLETAKRCMIALVSGGFGSNSRFSAVYARTEFRKCDCSKYLDAEGVEYEIILLNCCMR